MPTKTLPYTDPMQDKRRKIHPEDHEQIKRDYNELQSQRKTAQLWGVSRRTIQFITQPDKLKKNKEARAKRGGSKVYYQKYGKEYHRQNTQKHRTRKRKAKLTTAKRHNKPINAEPIPQGYLTARQAGDKHHAHQDTIKKYNTAHHFPKSWNYPLYKITELEEWDKNHRTKHQLSRIKL